MARPGLRSMGKSWYTRELQEVADARGRLLIGELERDVPFLVRRFFVATDIPAGVARGGHAHKTIEQFAVCLRGSLLMILTDGEKRERIVLSSPKVGVYIPAMVWDEQREFSEDALLLVLASKEYDEADYVRNYEDFRRLVDPAA
jgi:UDP-2-acetamido-3-amino-2,3-dideoxy-glucuronate N-acetyltransferase